jgi:hypothetical protein
MHARTILARTHHPRTLVRGATRALSLTALVLAAPASYGKLITGRIINAYSCEYCYFTPTREAADLGGQLDVPTLNMVGTKDEFFGPPPSGDWAGSIAYHISEDKKTGWGETPSGNAYASFKRQGLKTGLVATFVGAEHDGTLAADNAMRDVLYSFMTAPLRCTELLDQWSETEYLKANTTVKRRCLPALGTGAAPMGEGVQVDVQPGSDILWVEIDQKHGIAADVPYGMYKTLARRWGREVAHEHAKAERAKFAQLVTNEVTKVRESQMVAGNTDDNVDNADNADYPRNTPPPLASARNPSSIGDGASAMHPPVLISRKHSDQI